MVLGDCGLGLFLCIVFIIVVEMFWGLSAMSALKRQGFQTACTPRAFSKSIARHFCDTTAQREATPLLAGKVLLIHNIHETSLDGRYAQSLPMCSESFR